MFKHRLTLRLVFSLCILFSAHVSWAESDLEIFATSSVWQRVYQYRNSKSKIESEIFFFSNSGPSDPLKELKAAIVAYQDTKKLYGTLQLPAACAFPARKKIIEKGLGLKFPEPPCTDLNDWIHRFNADEMAIDFAGVYSGNPASILGHTFLRYFNSNKAREGISGEGHDLLSYAVGFLAVANPGDSRAMYMVRGLTGQYPGYYQIEPFYMKVGIYNNSESRDIWEQKLNFTPVEVELSLLLLWEYSFNAKIPYYFIDENCSYRILSLLEVIRPDINLLSELPPVVLPPETVRVLIEKGVADPNPKFMSSILRRLNLKIEKFSPDEKLEFENSKKNINDLKKIKNKSVLDALIDYWTYTNYRAETNLKEKDSALMEATFLKRASLPEVSNSINEEELQARKNLIPPYLGHKTSSLSFSGGAQKTENKSQELWRGSYRMGAHALTDPKPGYDGIAAIEYLGFDIESRGVWNALLLDVKSLEPINAAEKKWSWLAAVSLDKNKNLLADTRLLMKGGGGGSYALSDWGKVYFIAEASSQTWIDTRVDGIIGIGFETGLILNLKKEIFLMNNESIWNRQGYSSQSNFILNHQLGINHQLFASFSIEDFASRDLKKSWSLGYKMHF